MLGPQNFPELGPRVDYLGLLNTPINLLYVGTVYLLHLDILEATIHLKTLCDSLECAVTGHYVVDLKALEGRVFLQPSHDHNDSLGHGLIVP